LIDEKVKVRGTVCITVYGKDGRIKRGRKNWLQKLFNLQPALMIYRNHNTLTLTGMDMIVDWMMDKNIYAKLKENNSFIQLGKGWTGTYGIKNNRCNTPLNSFYPLDKGYPKEGKNERTELGTILFRWTIHAGQLEAEGINEVILLNGNTESAKSFAYAEIRPALNIQNQDSLVIEWEMGALINY